MSLKELGHYEYHKQYRERNREYFRQFYKRYRSAKKPLTKKLARDKVKAALAEGFISKSSVCDCCMEEKYLYGHHESYKQSQWLDVLWLCKECHIEIHRGEKRK